MSFPLPVHESLRRSCVVRKEPPLIHGGRGIARAAKGPPNCSHLA